jgi:hypothetical protein
MRSKLPKSQKEDLNCKFRQKANRAWNPFVSIAKRLDIWDIFVIIQFLSIHQLKAWISFGNIWVASLAIFQPETFHID